MVNIAYFKVVSLGLLILFLSISNSNCINNLRTQNNKDEDNFIKVNLLVFSGTVDPTWNISKIEFESLEKLIINNKFQAKKTTRVMGYQGFVLLNNDGIFYKIKGNPTAELFLLKTMRINLSDEVTNHVLEKISTEYEFLLTNTISLRNMKSVADEYVDELSTLEFLPKFGNSNCDETPVRGPDSVPIFNPKTDDGGCFVEKQYDNNCYNYGSDVLTNTFAQPGRGTEHKWVENTCEDVRRAAESDGLTWFGTETPTSPPAQGHYITLLIWPNTNFHWVRLDSNGYWSHKPGGTKVKNTDNDGNLISDPSKQDFSPWSQFCGYFNVIPSKITID